MSEETQPHNYFILKGWQQIYEDFSNIGTEIYLIKESNNNIEDLLLSLEEPPTKKAKCLVGICEKTIAKLTDLCDKSKKHIQNVGDKTDILDPVSYCIPALHKDSTLKYAHQLQNKIEKALKCMEETEKCKNNKEMEDDTKKGYLMEANGFYDFVTTRCLVKIKNSIESICNRLKNPMRFSNFSPVYNSTTSPKIYVSMFANSDFSNQTPLLGIQKDATLMEEFTRNSGKFELECHPNQTKQQTDLIIKNLSAKDFKEYSSIVVIFDSHGAEDKVCTKDDIIPTSELWQWCDENPSICEQPVVIIIETCRGYRDEKCGYTSKSLNNILSHPNKHNMLVVYSAAYGHTAKCGPETGSEFLVKLLDVLKADKFKDWDILAQITEASKVAFNNQVMAQTVNYLSLLPSQLKLNGGNAIHDWKDVESYDLVKHQKMRALFFCHPNLKKQAENLSDVMKNLNIEVPDGIQECFNLDPGLVVTKNDPLDILFIVVMGLTSCDEIHTELLPSIRKRLSHKQCPALISKPKVILFLGAPLPVRCDLSSEKNAVLPPVAETSMDVSTRETNSKYYIVSENSDVLAYCDSEPDCLDAMQKILKAAPGNEEGFVRLLTTLGMARFQALFSSSPPHIESSLRYKLVLPKPDEST